MKLTLHQHSLICPQIAASLPLGRLESARKQGRIGGRRPKLDAHQQKEIVAMVTSGQKTAAETARLFKIHPATVSRLLALQLQKEKGATNV